MPERLRNVLRVRNQGGVFLGVGTSCRDGGCTLGACCFPDDLVNAMSARDVTSGAPAGCFFIVRAQCEALGCPQKGWNFVDILLPLTQDQPVWWSVRTGQPMGVSPFTVLDP